MVDVTDAAPPGRLPVPTPVTLISRRRGLRSFPSISVSTMRPYGDDPSLRDLVRATIQSGRVPADRPARGANDRRFLRSALPITALSAFDRCVDSE